MARFIDILSITYDFEFVTPNFLKKEKFYEKVF